MIERLPSCPGCGSNKAVDQFIGKQYRHDVGREVEYYDIRGLSWWCGTCNLMFKGSDDEWRAGRIGRLSRGGVRNYWKALDESEIPV